MATIWDKESLMTAIRESDYWLYAAIIALYKVTFDDELNWEYNVGLSDKFYGMNEDDVEELEDSDLLDRIINWHKNNRNLLPNISQMWKDELYDIVRRNIDTLVLMSNKDISVSEDIPEL